MHGCSSQDGGSGGPQTLFSVDMKPFHYTTHPPLPHDTNLYAYPQHMTMTGIHELHTRNSFQAVKFDQVHEFLVLLPKINYMLYHIKVVNIHSTKHVRVCSA